jgi:FKBP-type peptidyl-prolyl cis-trans isomerase
MTRLSLAALLLATACGSAPAKEPAAPTPTEASAPAAPTRPVEGPKTPGDPPLPVVAPPADAVRTASGIAYKILVEGSGTPPGRNDTIALRGSSWFPDGTLLFSARSPDDTQGGPLWAMPASFAEVMALLKPGGRVMFWVPAQMTGEPMGRVFDLELVSVTPGLPPPAAVASPPKGAAAIGDGIRVLRITKGTGTQKPRPSDTVALRYRGWDGTGRSFDSNDQPTAMAFLKRERPALRAVVARMVAGEKVHAWIPAAQAPVLEPVIEGDALYEIDLVSIVPPAPGTPAIPDDVAAPPKRAKKTTGGVSYRVLTKGTGTEKPTEASTVTVHYTGWTTDGAMFDSSVVRGTPATFPLAGVIPGWREALPTMVVGEKTRFWIPAELAYGKTPPAGAPEGMLVFDVELVSIEKAAP